MHSALVLLFSLFATHIAAADKSPLPIPSDLAPDVQLSINLGRALYWQDQASGMGTDALAAKLESLNGKGLIGYITVQQADESGRPVPSWQVLFFVDAADPKIAYRIRVPMAQHQKAEVEALAKLERPSPAFLNLFRARQTAIKAAQPFTQPINPAIFPAEIIGRQGILVELIAGTTKPDTVVIGRHYRVIVSPDGGHATSVLPLSNTALELPKGSGTEALVVTQLVTDYPLETHVFESMLNRVPLYVWTERGVWLVNGDSITLLSKEQPGRLKKK